MILSIREIIDLAIIIAVLGYIFKDVFIRPISKTESYDPLKALKSRNISGFKFAIAVTAPAIILHEFGHKFVAMALGYQAQFFAACSSANLLNPGGFFDFPCMLLFIGIIAKLLNFGFIFFIPGYVAHSAISNPLHSSLIAFAGPFVNLVLWLVPIYMIKYNKLPKKYEKHSNILILTAKINMFLFFFNMIPVPPFDGFQVFSGIAQYLF